MTKDPGDTTDFALELLSTEEIRTWLDGVAGSAEPDPYLTDWLATETRRTCSTDPGEVLAAIGRLTIWLELREESAVLDAREAGWTWQRIASARNKSKQAVWEMYRDAQDVAE